MYRRLLRIPARDGLVKLTMEEVDELASLDEIGPGATV
jgi:hypothetical protein